ncbi:hypothetical protein PIB30_051683, partial [Stylosanthes scabra]|nr:hypothetical protein [Stylosanthes scabra]
MSLGQNSIVSSANCRCESSTKSFPTSRGLINPELRSFINKLFNTSPTKTNRNGVMKPVPT